MHIKEKNQVFTSFFAVIMLAMTALIIVFYTQIGSLSKIIAKELGVGGHIEILTYMKLMCGVALTLVFILIIGFIMFTLSNKYNWDTFRILDKSVDKMLDGDYDVENKLEGDDELSLVVNKLDKLALRMQNEIKDKKYIVDETRDAISNISHDLKTPMSSILGYAEGILDGVANTPEKRENYARIIISKVNFMNQLLSELSYYSSIDVDGIMSVYTPVSASNYFSDCVDDLSMDLQINNIEFIYVNAITDDVMICIDEEKISKVVRNIIGNSVKYIDKEHGVIMLKVEDQNDNILVSIQDNGAGISEEAIPHIFERYYKGDPARSSVGGSGIGLSIVKKIVEEHGGTVKAQSSVGEGTIISFTLKKFRETI